MGVFATRSPFRPNGLGLSSVVLERIQWDTPEGPVLHVRGADLVSGTPIFDIKPYLAYTDSHPEAAGGFTAGLAGEKLRVACPEPLLAAVPPESAVLFDSVTACLACQMFSGPSPDAAAPERTAEELLAVSRRVRHLVCVCDEIWRDGVTYETWTETYRRGLAAVCRALAAEFDAVAELSAGCVRMWKGELPDA